MRAAISRGLAKRVAGSGVTVNAVLPGPTLSEAVEAMLEESADNAGLSIEEAATAFREGEPAELNHPAPGDGRRSRKHGGLYASPQASATTGAGLRVDGGAVDTIA